MKVISKFSVAGIVCATLVTAPAFPAGAARTKSLSNKLASPKQLQVEKRIRHIEAGHLLVRFKDSVSATAATATLSKFRSAKVQTFQNRMAKLQRIAVPAGQEAKVLSQLKSSPDVEYAEFNELVPAVETPNDPGLGGQWHLGNIGAYQAWDVSKGTNPVVVAILDSGVNVNHSDLASRIVAGRNVVDDNDDVSDVQGHGTEVAGSAVADTNNGNGIASPCWNCQIMPIRVAFNQNGGAFAYYSEIVEGMIWAADHGAKILNISYAELYKSASVGDAANYVRNRGGIVFGAAGNAGEYVSSNVSPEIVFVSATGGDNNKTWWSNYGPIVSISAPGENIYTTDRNGGYVAVSGTSFASPMVAGVAALVWSTNPNLTNAQVKSIVLSTVDDIGNPGKDDYYGNGKVNAYKAAQLAFQTLPAPPPPPPPQPPPSSDWTRCAEENGTCSFSGTRNVRYGEGNNYVTVVATGSIACNNATFGDPAYGVAKHCDYSNVEVQPPAPQPTQWTWCASENGTCSFSGTRTVRYGAGDSYVTKTATDTIACNNDTFGDPAWGIEKHCDFSDAQTAFMKH